MKSLLLFRLTGILATLVLLSSCKTVSQFQPNIPNGGRILSMSVHPQNDQTVIVAAETGGLFKTVNGGYDWQHLDGMKQFRMSDVKYASTNSNIVLTTALADLKPGKGGAGIWRSTNGGNTWNHIDLQPSISGIGVLPRAVNAYGIAFDPVGTTVIVGTNRGLGVSKDNGASWSLINTPSRDLEIVYSVAVLDKDNWIAVTDKGIHTTSDGGQTWNITTLGFISAGYGPNRLAVSPLNSKHVFLATNIIITRPDPTNNNQPAKFYATYFSKDGGRNWTELQVPKYYDSVRECFIRTGRSLLNLDREFHLYYSDGISMFSKRVIDENGNLNFTNSWITLNLGHNDPSDIVFDQNKRFPTIISGDGGIMKLDANSNRWEMRGGGTHGLNALQLTDVNGMLSTVFIESSGEESTAYILLTGTWDNYVWQSNDGGSSWYYHTDGEGFYMQPEGRRKIRYGSGDGPFMVYVSCALCANVVVEESITNKTYWPNANNHTDGNPWYLLKPRHYIQNKIKQVTNASGTRWVNSLEYTYDLGANWIPRIEIPGTLRHRYHIVNSNSGPVIYMAIQRSGVDSKGNGKIGLIRIKNFTGPGSPIAYDADGEGFGSLAVMWHAAEYPVMAVNPSNPLHVIIADLDTDEMKYTYDGGKCWFVDQALTDLVTENGKLMFSGNGLLQPHVIAFDPDYPQRVAVGTREAGIFLSTDAGVTWSPVPDTKQITYISSFFFGFHNDLIVTTYGRGMWKIKLPSRNLKNEVHRNRFCGSSFFTNNQDGVQTTFEDPTDVPGGMDGFVAISEDGEITDIKLNADGYIESVILSSGKLISYDSLLQERPVTEITQTISSGKGRFERLPEALRLIDQGKHIRGIVLVDENILGFITSDEVFGGYEKQLVAKEITDPYLYVLDSLGHPIDFALPGQKITLRGINYTPSLPVSIIINDKLLDDHIMPDTQGNFSYEWNIFYDVGVHKIIAEQIKGVEKKVAGGRIGVRVEDKARE